MTGITDSSLALSKALSSEIDNTLFPISKPEIAAHNRSPRYKTYAFDNFKKSKGYAKKGAMKQAVISPSMLYLLYPLNGEVEGYPKERFVHDLVNEVRLSRSSCTARLRRLL